MKLALVVAFGLLVGAGSGIAFARVHRDPARPVHVPREMSGLAPSLRIPRASQPISVDGEIVESAWSNAGQSGSFVGDDGMPARPYSDAHFTWRDGMLYVALYAADEDIRTTRGRHDDPLWTADAFELTLVPPDGVPRIVEISAEGVVTDAEARPGSAPRLAWESGAVVAVDRDGTPNDDSDEDEEWALEVGIPLVSLGLSGRAGEALEVRIQRCDMVRDVGAARRRACGAFPANGRARLVFGP